MVGYGQFPYGFKLFVRNKNNELQSITSPRPGICAWANHADGVFDIHTYRCPVGIVYADHNCGNCPHWNIQLYEAHKWNYAEDSSPFALFDSYEDMENFAGSSHCLFQDYDVWLVRYIPATSPDWELSVFATGTIFASAVMPVMNLNIGEENHKTGAMMIE